MMTQTLALLWDAYRELNSKKMFWVVLVLSVLVMGAFALLGATQESLTIAGKEILNAKQNSLLSPMAVYKTVFSEVVVGWWLTWLAALLALISTAGMFPDFLSSGAIDLYLARPISRTRLFLTKYLAGLLFVTLQVTLFSFMAFLVLGIRAGLWQPGLFLAVPLVVLFFSYLFAICAFFGVWTRSTIAALLLTLLAWFGIFGVDYVDYQINVVKTMMTGRQAQFDAQLEALDRRIAQVRTTATAPGDGPPAPGGNLQTLEERRKDIAAQRAQLDVPPALLTAQKICYGIKTFVPKTRETTNLLDRVLFSDKELQEASRHTDTDEELVNEALQGDRRPFRSGPPPDVANIQLRLERERSVLWIVGTSLVFEAAVLAVAAWMFNRRDF